MVRAGRTHWHLCLRQAWRLVLLSVAVGVALWLVRDDRLPLLADPDVYTLDLPVPLVSVIEALDLYEDGSHLFVDTRGGDFEQRPQIPGSFVIRETSFADDLAEVMDFIYPEDQLILYGEANPLPVSAVAARFVERGYANVRILQGGLSAWSRGGGPVDEKDVGDEKEPGDE